MANRTRKNQIHFMVDDEEREIINRKIKELGGINISEYLRRMAIYGYIIEIDVEPLNNISRELGYIGNNINQLTKRANQTGSIYVNDINEIRNRLDDINENIIATIGKIIQ